MDWQDPAVELRSARAAVFLANVAAGCFIWEFFLGLFFDWELVSRKRVQSWLSIVYLGSRYATLLCVVAGFRITNVLNAINACTAWWKFVSVCGHTALAFASLILVLRVVSLSHRNRYIAAILSILWGSQVVALLYGGAMARGEYMAAIHSCAPVNTVVGQYYIFAPLTLDVLCLVLSTTYLGISKGAGCAGLWWLFITQGLIYNVAICIAYLALSVLLALNLNPGMNAVMQLPALVCLIISATRLFRATVQNERNGFDVGLDLPATTHSRSYLSPRSTFSTGVPTSPSNKRHFSLLPWRQTRSEPERGIVLPPSFARANLDYQEQESVPRTVSPNSSRGKITMFKDSTDQLPATVEVEEVPSTSDVGHAS